MKKIQETNCSGKSTKVEEWGEKEREKPGKGRQRRKERDDEEWKFKADWNCGRGDESRHTLILTLKNKEKDAKWGEFGRKKACLAFHFAGVSGAEVRA